MILRDYITANGNSRASLDERITAVENNVAQNTQDISDNTDAIAELGELIGGDTVG